MRCPDSPDAPRTGSHSLPPAAMAVTGDMKFYALIGRRGSMRWGAAGQGGAAAR
eukprot:gene4838-2250_t